MLNRNGWGGRRWVTTADCGRWRQHRRGACFRRSDGGRRRAQTRSPRPRGRRRCGRKGVGRLRRQAVPGWVLPRQALPLQRPGKLRRGSLVAETVGMPIRDGISVRGCISFEHPPSVTAGAGQTGVAGDERGAGAVDAACCLLSQHRRRQQVVAFMQHAAPSCLILSILRPYGTLSPGQAAPQAVDHKKASGSQASHAALNETALPTQ